ncbi:MAG TPA: diguanylate cyclase [Myxococcota bacterium]|nr:diguanylate cyclase [Myxococcota bacterium]
MPAPLEVLLELERDALRIAARALGELATGPARPQREVIADVLAQLCALLGASGALAAERVPPARAHATLRVLARHGLLREEPVLGAELPLSSAALRAALETRRPWQSPASAEACAALALPLVARDELLGALAFEREDADFAPGAQDALAPFAEALGELLLGYERSALRARAEEDLVRSQRHLRRSAALDGLTGLANKAATQRALEDAADRSHRAGLPLALIAVDVDHAKPLADRLGAAGFDEALARTARTLHDTVRPNDWTGRWGIDSFVIALLGCEAEGAAVVAERIRLRIEGTVHTVRGGAEASLTVSAGVASTGLVREEAGELVARSFRALEEAKRAGRNRVCVLRPARA